jgi:hypothetical protein
LIYFLLFFNSHFVLIFFFELRLLIFFTVLIAQIYFLLCTDFAPLWIMEARTSKRLKNHFHIFTLPDDILTSIFQFAVDSLRTWSWMQCTCHEFRTCVRKPNSLSHLTLDLQNRHLLDRLGPASEGVSTVKLSGALHRPIPSARHLILPLATDSCLDSLVSQQLLQSLDMSGHHFHDRALACVSMLSCLESLRLHAFEFLTNLTPLSNLTALKELRLEMFPEIVDLSPLSALTTLRTLSLKGCTSIANLRPLGALVNLCDLNLKGCWLVSCESLALLSNLVSLRSLILSDCAEICNAGLQHLANLPLLELYLDGCSLITDEGLHALQNMKTLQRLDLYATLVTPRVLTMDLFANVRHLKLPFPVTDSVLLLMNRMRQLEELQMTFPLTDLGMSSLSELTGLRSLHLRKGDRITSVGLHSLSSLRNLKCLTMCCLKIGCLSALSAMVGLSALDLSASDTISSKDLEALRPLVGLTSLDISGCFKVDDLGILALSTLINLRVLKLRGVSMTDRGMAGLSPMVALRTLDLSFDMITDAGLHALSCMEALHHTLNRLSLMGCTLLTDKGIGALTVFTGLNKLNVSGCSLTDAMLHDKVSQFLFLKSLNLAACANITDKGLIVGLNGLQLTSLNLSGCYEITDIALRCMKLSTLTNLDLSDCDQLTDDGMACLQACPKLKTLDVSLCDHITGVGLSHVTHVESVTSFLCFGVSTQDDYEAEVVIQPDPFAFPANERANELLIAALLKYEPRDRETQRCMFIEPSEDHLELTTGFKSNSVSVPVHPNTVDWSYVASRFGKATPGVHTRWAFFFLGYRDWVRVHARPVLHSNHAARKVRRRRTP